MPSFSTDQRTESITSPCPTCALLFLIPALLELTTYRSTQVRSWNPLWKGRSLSCRIRGMVTDFERRQMVLELGDTSTVKNDINGLSCDIEFKTKVRLSLPSPRQTLTISHPDRVSFLVLVRLPRTLRRMSSTDDVRCR